MNTQQQKDDVPGLSEQHFLPSIPVVKALSLTSNDFSIDTIYSSFNPINSFPHVVHSSPNLIYCKQEKREVKLNILKELLNAMPVISSIVSTHIRGCPISPRGDNTDFCQEQKDLNVNEVRNELKIGWSGYKPLAVIKIPGKRGFMNHWQQFKDLAKFQFRPLLMSIHQLCRQKRSRLYLRMVHQHAHNWKLRKTQNLFINCIDRVLHKFVSYSSVQLTT